MKSSTENIYKQKVNQVIDYINFNLHQPLQLNVIADIVNMSQRLLLRMMSSALDEPLYSYVARQRVERAVLYIEFIQMYDCPISPILEILGYGFRRLCQSL